MKKYKQVISEIKCVQEVSENMFGEDYVVGDIHGMFTNLEEKLSEINFNKKYDRLFSVGDLVDRGNESHRVDEFINQPWFYSVRGNHDEFVLRSYYNDKDFSNESWENKINGGSWWFKLCKNRKKEIAESISNLPLTIELKTKMGLVVIAHANLPFFLSWETIKKEMKNQYIKDYIQWNRDRANDKKTEEIDGIYRAYFGHTTTNEISTSANSLFIDTGSGYEGFKGTKFEKNNPRITIMKIK